MPGTPTRPLSAPLLFSQETIPAPPPTPGSVGNAGAGRGGSPAPRPTSPTPFSPLSPHECNISFLAVTREAVPEGLLAAGEAEGCPEEKTCPVPGRRVGTARPQKFEPQAPSEGNPFSWPSCPFSALLPRLLCLFSLPLSVRVGGAALPLTVVRPGEARLLYMCKLRWLDFFFPM